MICVKAKSGTGERDCFTLVLSHSCVFIWVLTNSKDGSMDSVLGFRYPGMTLYSWKPKVTNQLFTSAEKRCTYTVLLRN